MKERRLMSALRLLKKDLESGKAINYIPNEKLDSVSAFLYNRHANRKEILQKDDYQTVLFFLERQYENSTKV